MATELEDIEQLDIPEIENIEQPPRKKSFKANGKIFDIPEDKVGDFKKRYSDAQEIQSFTNNGKTYDIPIERVEEFKQKYPDAKTLGGTQQPQSPQPTPKFDFKATFGNVNQPLVRGDIPTYKGTPKQAANTLDITTRMEAAQKKRIEDKAKALDKVAILSAKAKYGEDATEQQINEEKQKRQKIS